MTKDYLGLNKVSKSFKDLEKNNIFNEPKQKQRKFPKPKPYYTKQNKPIMTKENQEQAVKIIKSTGSAFAKIASDIKNRKIRKLEKTTLKNIKLAEDMAHELKTIQENKEALVDIERYKKELEKERNKK